MFDCTSSEIMFCFEVKWCLRIFGKFDMSLHEGCKTAASVERELSDHFSVKAGNHQRSVLSLLFFAIVMGVLSDVRDGSLMELLYAEDLALLGES